MALARCNLVIQDEDGNIVNGASVEVRRESAGAPLAVVYSDRDGASSLGNPFTASDGAEAGFHVVGGAYKITATLGAFTRTWRYVAIGTGGENDIDAVKAGLLLTWDIGTADADPTAGKIRANHASLASATFLYIDDLNRAGSSIEAFLLQLDDSTNDIKGYITLTDPAAETQAVFRVTSIVDAAGYVKVAVAGHSGATSFTDGDPINLQFSRTGDKSTTVSTYDDLKLHGADIASAATIDLEAATGDLVDVTGTTTITAITLDEGHQRTVGFTGSLTLTHGASLVLPDQASIKTAAGDFATFRGYAAGVVRCVSYQRLNRRGADVASAGTINLDLATGDIVDVTGTTTITAVTLTEGRECTVRFASELIITHNGSTLLVPGAGNLKTIAGEYVVFRGYAAGVVRVVSRSWKRTILFGSGGVGTIAAGATRYIGAAILSTIETDVVFPLGILETGVLRNLEVLGNSPGVGQSLTCTLRKTLADSALVATITSGVNTARDNTNSVTVVNQDRVAVKMVNSAGGNVQGPVSWSVELWLP